MTRPTMTPDLTRPIPTVPLGTTGEQVSALALGCMPMGTLADEETSFALLDRYLEDGGSFLDTADNYAAWWAQGTFGGQSEALLGRWLASRKARDRVFLSTKGSAGWTDPEGVWPAGQAEPSWDRVPAQWTGAGAGRLRESLEASLRRLGTETIDLYFVHVDDRATPLEETLETLAGFVKAGAIRHYGYSNVRSWRLEAIHRICEQHGWPAPVALQQEHSLLQRRAGLSHAAIVDDEQLDLLRARPELTLIAYSPILKGLYDLPAEERTAFWVYDKYAGEHSERRLAALDRIAAEHDAPPSRVVIAWLLAQRDPRRIPLIGTGRPERYRSLAAAVELELSAEQLAALNDA